MSKIFYVDPKTGIIVETDIGYAWTKHPSGKYITVKPQNQEELDRLIKQSENAKKALIGYSENGTGNALKHSREVLAKAKRASEAKANNSVPESKLLSLEELRQAAEHLMETKFEINIDGKAYDSDLNSLTWGEAAAFQMELKRKDLTEKELIHLNGELERLTPDSNEQILRHQVRFNHLTGFMKKLKASGWTTSVIGKGSFTEQIILSAKNVLGDNALIILEADEKFSVKLETPQCSPDARKLIQNVIQESYRQMGIETIGTCSDNVDPDLLDHNCVQPSNDETESELKKETYSAKG